jgi:hypothetical protein
MQPLRIVVRYLDGATAKGTTHNFDPHRPVFHVVTPEDGAGARSRQVHLSAIKAVFFVASFEGQPEHRSRTEFGPADQTPGRRARVEFVDGEQLSGTVFDFRMGAPGFFLFPVDTEGNNQKVFVVSGAVREVTFL